MKQIQEYDSQKVAELTWNDPAVTYRNALHIKKNLSFSSLFSAVFCLTRNKNRDFQTWNKKLAWDALIYVCTANYILHFELNTLFLSSELREDLSHAVQF